MINYHECMSISVSLFGVYLFIYFFFLTVGRPIPSFVKLNLNFFFLYYLYFFIYLDFMCVCSLLDSLYPRDRPLYRHRAPKTNREGNSEFLFFFFFRCVFYNMHTNPWLIHPADINCPLYHDSVEWFLL